MSHVHSKWFDFILLDIKFGMFIMELYIRVKSILLKYNNGYYQLDYRI